MENIAVSRLMRIINSLNVDTKLEILSKISESLKVDFSNREDNKLRLLEELSGAWSDMDDNIVDIILNARTPSNRKVNLD